jgi:uncharacterized protein (TIGR03790 family)
LKAGLLLVLILVAAGFARGAGNVFLKGSTRHMDSSARLVWTLDPAEVERLGLERIRVFRLLHGDEMGFGKEKLVRVAEVPLKDGYTAGNLENGAQYVFLARAVDGDGHEHGQVVFMAYPGRDGQGPPPALSWVYALPGPDGIGIFWDRNRQVDLAGYQIARKTVGEEEFTVLGVVRKVTTPGKWSRAAKGKTAGNPMIRPTMFLDPEAAPGVKYVYRVRPVDLRKRFGPPVSTGPVSLAQSRSPRPEEILILTRARHGASRYVARHYATQRGVPEANILELYIPEAGHEFDYERHLAAPVRAHLLETGMVEKVRVLMPCLGIPYSTGGRSVDSLLSDLFGRYTWGRLMGTPNPMFGTDAHFDPALGLYLVTRLDGPDEDVAAKLVEKARAAEANVTASAGKAYFVDDENGREGAKVAENHGVDAVLRGRMYTRENSLPGNVMWFFAWGHDYVRTRKDPWPTGAVAAYLKSNSFHTLGRGTDEVSWVQGLLREGVTATFGSVVEPYVQGFTRGDIFFDRFWSGEYTFAEAFAMSTPTVRWAMSAVGDPLYRIRPASGEADGE